MDPIQQESAYCIGLIPARGGSKGIPRKNIRPLAGRPLIGYTIGAAAAARCLARTLLSTDDTEIASYAAGAGVEVPFLRPAHLAADQTPTLDVIRYTLDWLDEHEDRLPDVVVLLQPTTPLRRSEHIDAAVTQLLESDADSVVSVTPVPSHFNPHWQFTVAEGCLRLFNGAPWQRLITRRQELPETYCRNGAIYAFRTAAFLRTNSFYGEICAPYIMPTELSVNIDTMDDWNAAETFLRRERMRDAG